MVNFIAKIRGDRFLTNSLIFFIGSFLVGIGGYLYQFLMARMLTVETYGELQAILAIFVIIGIPIGVITTVLTKWTADFKAKNWLNKIYTLFLLFTKKSLIAAIIFFIIFVILSGFIARFLNLTSILPLVFLGIGLLFSFSSSINNGILQGLQKFKELSIISIISTFLKILFAVLLVNLGFAINGAVGAIVLSGLIGYLISFYPLKFLFQQQKEKLQIKEIFQYSFPVFFILLFISLLYNTDIILVKHFFSAQTAGEYGALAMLGHIIFFITGPIVGVMFPMAVAAHSNHTDSTKVFKKTIFLVGLIGGTILLSYFFVPDFIIKILIGSKFLSISKYLGWFGLSMFLFSLVNLFSSYFLSTDKIKCAYLMGIGVLLQIILISIFHANLWQIIWIMNAIMFFTLALLIFYYFKIKIKKCLQN
ncbi:oligosaccharide flippase family protein [Patescibacteria group bacterium]|nr:oligosaccharide flippase family protein [Patescibacteria group bacterium]MBU4480902.1 oligosaccharide flippase family protein [Patescibacteria group bacterium]